MNEQQKQEEQKVEEEEKVASITESDFKYIRSQWRYKTIALVVIIACIASVIAASISYYIASRKKIY